MNSFNYFRDWGCQFLYQINFQRFNYCFPFKINSEIIETSSGKNKKKDRRKREWMTYIFLKDLCDERCRFKNCFTKTQISSEESASQLSFPSFFIFFFPVFHNLLWLSKVFWGSLAEKLRNPDANSAWLYIKYLVICIVIVNSETMDYR